MKDNFQPHFKKEFNNHTKVDVLLDPRFEDVEKKEILMIADEAISIVKKHNPEWCVQEDLTLIALNTSAKTGIYVGKWEGRHHILITIKGKDDFKNSQKRISLVLLLVHELLHQRVSEIKNVDDINGLRLKEKISHRVLKSMSPFERAQTLSFGAAHASLLQKVINEGCAVYNELKILESMLNSGEISMEQRTAILQSIKWRKNDLAREKGKRESTYFQGYNLVIRLLDIFPSKELVELLDTIDWDLCGEIGYDSPLYDKIIDNPKLIPGLSK